MFFFFLIIIIICIIFYHYEMLHHQLYCCNKFVFVHNIFYNALDKLRFPFTFMEQRPRSDLFSLFKSWTSIFGDYGFFFKRGCWRCRHSQTELTGDYNTLTHLLLPHLIVGLLALSDSLVMVLWSGTRFLQTHTHTHTQQRTCCNHGSQTCADKAEPNELPVFTETLSCFMCRFCSYISTAHNHT